MKLSEEEIKTIMAIIKKRYSCADAYNWTIIRKKMNPFTKTRMLCYYFYADNDYPLQHGNGVNIYVYYNGDVYAHKNDLGYYIIPDIKKVLESA